MIRVGHTSGRAYVPMARRILKWWVQWWVKYLALSGGVAATVLACTAWPIGARVEPSVSSSLVGTWAAPDVPGEVDRMVLQFRSDGNVELLRARPGLDSGAVTKHLWKSVWRSSWQVRASATKDPRPLVCFAYRAGREWPPCKFIRIDTVSTASGEPQRRLTLEGWAGEPHMTSEMWLEYHF